MICRTCGIEMEEAHAQHAAWHRAHDQELLALRRQLLTLHTEVRSLEDGLARFRALSPAAFDGPRRGGTRREPAVEETA